MRFFWIFATPDYTTPFLVRSYVHIAKVLLLHYHGLRQYYTPSYLGEQRRPSLLGQSCRLKLKPSRQRVQSSLYPRQHRRTGHILLSGRVESSWGKKRRQASQVKSSPWSSQVSDDANIFRQNSRVTVCLTNCEYLPSWTRIRNGAAQQKIFLMPG